jgi:hypothetical protein
MSTGIEAQIAQWRAFLAERPAVSPADADELEAHLRDHLDALTDAGLSADEAFLVAARRVGSIDDVAKEFAREHSERLWKQLVLDQHDGQPNGFGTALACAVLAALAVVSPALFGFGLTGNEAFHAVNAVPVVLAFVTGLLAIRRSASPRLLAALAVPFVLTVVALNAYPFDRDGSTQALSVLHGLVLLWLVVGAAYANGHWRSTRHRMDFVRFTGEWVVYMALIALGGGVLVALTLGAFAAVGVDAELAVANVIVPGGAAGAAVIATWLVEAKQGVIENITPVLARLFLPLFTVFLTVLVATGVVQRDVVGSPRGLLILFDLVLLVVIALVLYTLSSRDRLAPPGWTDRLMVVLVSAAIIVDTFVLAAMLGRIGEFGMSANKAASLGLNVVLWVNLCGTIALLVRFLRGHSRHDAVERWQTSFLPVYFAWAAIVAFAFPLLFDFA